MMILMPLCLLVYNLGQKQLRSSLKTEKSKVKNQVNKLTESPTLLCIFQSQCVGRLPRLVREAPLQEVTTGVCF
jgi:transposase